MEIIKYNTSDFLDSFEVNWSRGIEKYYLPHERIEESLLVFKADKKEYTSLLNFAYACIYEQYNTEKEFAKVIYKRGRHPAPHPPYIPWEKFRYCSGTRWKSTGGR